MRGWPSTPPPAGTPATGARGATAPSRSRRPSRRRIICLLASSPRSSVTPPKSARSRPFGPQPSQPLGAPAAGSNNPAPPREVPLVEKKFEQLSNQQISEDGRQALAINPAKWRHAETDNFIIHYRRVTEAQKVVREVEYDL